MGGRQKQKTKQFYFKIILSLNFIFLNYICVHDEDETSETNFKRTK